MSPRLFLGREAAFRLLAAGLGLLLALGLVEVVLRAVGGKSPPRRPTRVAERHQSEWHEPDFRRPPRPRTEAAFRIVALGDSFTWGAGVYAEDAWPARLERLLARAELARPVEVETIARPGWGTVQEVEALRRRVDRLAPDLILLAYVLNDAEPPPGRRHDELRAPLERRKPKGTSRVLGRASRLYALAWERLENTRQRRAFLTHYRLLYTQPGWNAARAALDRLRDLAAERGIPVVVVLFPIFDGPLDSRYSYRSLNEVVGAEARWRGFRVLDLLPAYRGVDPRRLALEPFSDAHPNELAHRMAAEALRDHLLAEELLR